MHLVPPSSSVRRNIGWPVGFPSFVGFLTFRGHFPRADGLRSPHRILRLRRSNKKALTGKIEHHSFYIAPGFHRGRDPTSTFQKRAASLFQVGRGTFKGSTSVNPLCTATLGVAATLMLVVAAAHSQPLPNTAPAVSADTNPIRTLPRLTQSLRARHAARILAIGSSSTAGIGASSPSRTYVARLETDLEVALTGMDFEVIGHGLSGEVAQGAADRMKREVEEAQPDLVIWQLGTNDALRHVDIESFKKCLKNTLALL